MTEFTQSIPLERSTLLSTCLLLTLAILLIPARATRNLSTTMAIPLKQQ